MNNMKQNLWLLFLMLNLYLTAQVNDSATDFDNLRFNLTYGSILAKDFETQSLSLQFHYENVLFKETMWTYRLGAGYARGFERTGFTDTKASRLNEFLLSSVLNYNLGDLKKQDFEIGVGPFASYINGNSDRFSGGDIIVIPAQDFSTFQAGLQALARLTWYGKRNTHSLLINTRVATNFFVATSFGYEIGI